MNNDIFSTNIKWCDEIDKIKRFCNNFAIADVNSVLLRKHYNRGGIHLNLQGKKAVCELFKDYISNKYKYYDSNCLLKSVNTNNICLRSSAVNKQVLIKKTQANNKHLYPRLPQKDDFSDKIDSHDLIEIPTQSIILERGVNNVVLDNYNDMESNKKESLVGALDNEFMNNKIVNDKVNFPVMVEEKGPDIKV